MRLARSVTAAVVVAAVVVGGITVAQAASFSAHDTGTAGAGAVTLPAQIISPTKSNERTSGGPRGTTGNMTSTNWSGYVATGGGFTSVTSSWVQPTVSCTSPGVVSFWVGLDGWGDNTVEQTGSGADCRSGSPQYYAWWETFPTNSQQTYSVAVSPGDHMTATATFTNGQYQLQVADLDQGWSKTTTAAAPTGSSNLSAEVVAEAASLGNNVTQLPDFGTASFTGGTINGNSLNNAGAQALNMVNSSGSVIASTGTADSSGDFAVTYTGGMSGVQGAYQASDGTLHTYGPTGDTPQQMTMQTGTSPSITQLPGSSGEESAYQGANGDLVVAGTAGTMDTQLGMLAGTNPSITYLSGGGFEVAFQANTGMLWTYSPGTAPTNLALGVYSGTSPSIATLADGSIQIAFEANTGSLWTYSSNGAAGSLHLGMSKGTSPSIAALPNSGYMIAFQANTNFLWTYTSGTSAAGPSAVNQALGMSVGTNPAIATASGGYSVAFQANTNTLWTFVSGVGASNQDQANQPAGMAAGTSPAIVTVPGGYESAFQATSGDFVVIGSSAPEIDTEQVMQGGTSPDLAP